MFTWADTWGGTANDSGNSVAIDGLGNAYVVGAFRGTVDFDPGSGVHNHTSKDDSLDVYLSKFDSAGDYVWTVTVGGSETDISKSVVVDDSGTAYVAGHYLGSFDFDPGPEVDIHTSNGFEDVFLTKFDSSGIFAWARTWGGISQDRGFSVALDGSANVYLAGDYTGTVDFNPGAGDYIIESNGYKDIFLSKFDSDGNFILTHALGGPNYDFGHSVVLDTNGNAYITGAFQLTVDFDPEGSSDYHTSNGDSDAFTWKCPTG